MLAIEKNTAPNPRKLFIAEGLWAHKLLLSTHTPVEVFFWSPEAAYGDEARMRAVEVAAVAKAAYKISAKTLERISERDRPDGLLSIAQLREWQPEDIVFGRSALVMVADSMEVPGNLGTLIRTADACRVDCVVLTNRRTRLSHPKVFRASQGMLLTVPIIEFEQPKEAASWLRENNFDVYLADTEDARNYRSLRYYDRRTAFVLGAERYGIPKAWYCPEFQRVFVPMLGAADSLNVSISAAVLLYEARAQKEKWLASRRDRSGKAPFKHRHRAEKLVRGLAERYAPPRYSTLISLRWPNRCSIVVRSACPVAGCGHQSDATSKKCLHQVSKEPAPFPRAAAARTTQRPARQHGDGLSRPLPPAKKNVWNNSTPG
ncbi:MAG: TrmH family RNA methyltransferase, partial [Streptosporangiaceae bacterium]